MLCSFHFGNFFFRIFVCWSLFTFLLSTQLQGKMGKTEIQKIWKKINKWNTSLKEYHATKVTIIRKTKLPKMEWKIPIKSNRNLF